MANANSERLNEIEKRVEYLKRQSADHAERGDTINADYLRGRVKHWSDRAADMRAALAKTEA